MGIICGAGIAEIAVILCVALTIDILILDKFPVVKAPMLLVVNASDLDAEAKVMELTRQYARHPHVKSRNMTATSLDLVVELRIDGGDKLVREIMKIEGICSASLMAHDGEVTF